MKKKKVLVLVSKRPVSPDSMNWHGLTEWLNELLGENVIVDISALSDLVYVAGEVSTIYDPEKGYDIADFDLVVMRTVGKELECAIAVAHYLAAKNVRFTDSYTYTQGRGKLACSFACVANGLPVPQTVYAKPKLLLEAIQNSDLEYPLILKADQGKKGKDNYLITSKTELQKALANCAKREIEVIAQEFIPNDGDYRILVLDGKPAFALFRQSAGKTHLTNTSQGGTASKIAIESLDPELVTDAVHAAALEALEVAGVDVVVDKNTSKYYFLEVNRAPQIPTGAFANEKMTAYAQMIKGYLQKLPEEKTTIPKELSVIGSTQKIDFVDAGAVGVLAKIDTGADLSSVWASNIIETSDGLTFTLFGEGSPYFTGQPVTVKRGNYKRRLIVNSFGTKESRYVVRLRIRVQGRVISTSFTLADRSQKAYPILLGRKFLHRKFLVDVSKGDPLPGK